MGKTVVDRYLSKLSSLLLCLRILQIIKGAIILKSRLAQYRYLDFNALRKVHFLKRKGLPIIIVIMMLCFEYIWILSEKIEYVVNNECPASQYVELKIFFFTSNLFLH